MKSVSMMMAVAVALGLCAIGAAADDAPQQSAAAAPPPAPAANLAAKGRAIYNENCMHCHGLNMINPGTVAYDLRQFPHNDKARFVNSVTHGKNNRMPAWGDILTPDQIDAVWAYVQTGGK
jgi:mono/diheme cytochrome c family protein